jgi:hypothetical protein
MILAKSHARTAKSSEWMTTSLRLPASLADIASHFWRHFLMKKTVLTFGMISGVMISVLMGSSLLIADKIGSGHSMTLGYTIMVASFLLIYFGIRSYRDNVAGGTITFGKAFQIGILISLISCVFYVVTWLVIYYNFMPDFMDKYAASMIEKARASGQSDVAVQKLTAEMAKYKEWYKNPLLVAAMTFMEPFPVGLIITLVSSAILRRKTASQPTMATVAV